MKNFGISLGRVFLTVAMVCLAFTLGLQLWSFYMEAPWTRDAYIRADTIRLAPDVTGQVTDVFVSDNAQVNEGSPIFRIETIRFELAFRETEARVESSEAAAELARSDFRRYQLLPSKQATSLKQAQQAESTMHQSEALYRSALASRDLARLNLERTIVRAPASGKLSNFSLQPGNYVSAGHAVGVLVEKKSIYVVGYFEETKLAKIHIGAPVKINLMGESQTFSGHITGIAAGIEEQQRSDTAGSLAHVTPTFSWVRLAQRIPVRIDISEPRETVKLIVGRTATVSIEQTPKAE